MIIFATLSLIIWIYLITARGNFWLCNQFLESQILKEKLNITIIIPARNEAENISICLESLLNQDYQGDFKIILVNDQSEDNTAQIAENLARKKNQTHRLIILNGKPLPQGWSGKLWAMSQGVEWARQNLSTDYFLFTDADIKHSVDNLSQLLAKAEKDNLDLVSLMVKLHCQSFWEKLLIPAFIFFFQKLYPFPLINNPRSKVSGAAGGCILIREKALTRIGGIEALKQALIDDCTLASLVKKSLPPNHGIWLGLSNNTVSLRKYPTLNPIWNMVARTAFTQLNYSTLLLIGTILGMFITYLISPIAFLYSLYTLNIPLLIISLITLLLMALSYYPTVKLYQLPIFYSFCLSAIAFLYTLMTIDSAFRHWQGKGGQWKGRVYGN
ncbi:glycosyltransferase [Cyanobacterium aponinum]|uniref:Hopene-associated glycosyltransferase HpnB n=1 Tax=Cyanobacterium aponinum (strain PCC 10605) TaxID=755178 RepID=K9Z589_CYAAP|nr:glycosyltransferase [Cyanobacterium aponinum]AFZ53715.1 hopene-associated glycosyltransferase HpnB [Cyanobacterium aponinum PCC 10605]